MTDLLDLLAEHEHEPGGCDYRAGFLAGLRRAAAYVQDYGHRLDRADVARLQAPMLRSLAIAECDVCNHHEEGPHVMSSIDSTLTERGSRYGQFDGHARITQNIKAAMQDSPNWSRLAPDQKEALEMAAHKFGRILNGDPNYIDSWHDVIGYTRLVEQRLEQEQNSKTPTGTSDTNQAATFGPLGVGTEGPCGCPRCVSMRNLKQALEATAFRSSS